MSVSCHGIDNYGKVSRLEYIFIFLKSRSRKGGEFDKLVIRDDKLIVNNSEFSIDELVKVEAEIIEHITVTTYVNGSSFDKTYPSGTITFTLKNGESFKVVSLNPLAKLEGLVLRLNTMYEKLGKPKLYIVESSTYRNVYSRE